jgi:alpha-mannosidase
VAADRSDVPRLFMVGNAHIDPMWIWDWDEGMHEVLQTFRAAADRLDEEPELRFTASSAAYYAWVRDTAPELFDRIRAHVEDGRWVVVGGQWVEPDCNLPAGESVCRQLLYGQRLLDRTLGVTATVGYNVDSFGHAGTLPQLLAASGIRAYVFMRPGPEEMEVPGHAFRWAGTDGTTLPAYRIPYDYSSRGDPEDELLRDRVTEQLEESRSAGLPLMGFFGIGDHGGGPTRLALGTIQALSDEHAGEICFGDPVSYFHALDDALGEAALPELRGELQWHAVGCYSVRAGLKLANARAEDALVAAEALNETCRLLTGDAPDVRHELEEAWKGVLFAQFHDALGGTCTERATEAAEALLVSARTRAEAVSVRAAHRVAEHVDTWVQGAESAENMESAIGGIPLPMLVFNPHSWPVTATVTLPHPLAVAARAGGGRTRIQAVASGEATYSPTRSLLRVSAPAFGYRRYWLHVTDPGSGAEPEAEPATVGDDWVLVNGILQARVDPASGRLADLVAIGGASGAPGGTALLAAGGVRPIAVDDDSDTWSHGVARYDGAEEEGRLCSVEVTERGPVRATVRSTWSFGDGRSTVRQEMSLFEGEPFVEVRLDADWHERRKVLKLVVPTSLADPVSTAGAPYGAVTRPCSGHEEPMVHWVDLSEANGSWGLACTADAAGGYDAMGPTLRLSVLRSPRVSDHGRPWGDDDPVGYPCTDQGRHRARYRLTPHAREAGAAQVARLAVAQRAELQVVLDTWHRGDLGPEASALQVNGDGVVVPVLKAAEDGGGTVVRLWEVAGATASVQLVRDGRTWSGELRAHELRTLLLPDDDPERAREIDVAEFRVRGRLTEQARALASLFERHPELTTAREAIADALALLCRTIDDGGTIYVGGNGGSAADAEHVVGELMKGMARRRTLSSSERGAVLRSAPSPLAAEADYLAEKLEGAVRAVCLTSQSGLLSAVSNDTAGDMGMAQQVHGYGRPGDLFWALSTSGTSRNVVLVALAPRAAGACVLAFTGAGGGRLRDLADVWVGVPAADTARVQELHQPIYHALCAAIEERYWPAGDVGP